MSDFVHLHNHTHFSLLDAVPTPGELIDAAIGDGQRAIALTDHGVMFGIMDFYKKANEKGIKPIIGMEAYVASGSRFDKDIKRTDTKKKNYYHLILLAKDIAGYKNLLKLTTLGHTEGFYYKPRIDRQLLEKYKDGLIASSACIGGVVNSHLVNGNFEAAREAAAYYKDLFGDDFYMELQNHNLPNDEIVLRMAPKIASEMDIKLLATNDVHYIRKDHAVAHNVLLMIRDATGANSGTADIHKLRYETPELYFKSGYEMKKLFADYPDSISNTLEVAEKCNCKLDLTKLYMPQFPIPDESESETLDDYLEELVETGMKQRFETITDDMRKRVRYELDVIEKMGFPGYFLIVWDFIRAARELGVMVGPGRGSAAGSLVAYALKITNVNPLPYNLLFERFLNPERISMPDIDIDFSDNKRDLVINYVKEKYGENAVAQIITFGTLSTRAAITDIGRVLGVDLKTVREITKKIPVIRGKVTPIKKALELHDLKWLKDSNDPLLKQLTEFAIILEGRLRNASTHAAGVVITPGEISDYVPLYQSPKSRGQSVDVATQYSMNELEDAGLLKMDFLGLRTLSIIENTIVMVERNHGVKIDIDAIDFEDKQTYDMISNGTALGVFQFESSGMQDYLKKLKPQSLEELTAMNALYRPGPMDNIPEFIDRKFGRKPITYLHPIMEKSLKNTYGIIVYQEQVMQLVRDIAGFSLSQADILRRAMGKKKQSLMDKQKPAFIDGAAKHGINSKMANKIFDLIVKFAEYGFNKSHSLAYSYLAFQTAWLKTHYPAEFLAANMTAENDQNKIVLLIEEAKKLKIEVLPPDVNRSFAEFTAGKDTIYFGLAGIKNVGTKPVESIVAARNEKPFTTFFDFVARVDTRLINKRAIEALVCSGAFDSLKSGHRAALMNSIEPALEYARSYANHRNAKMDSLFGGGTDAKPTEPNISETEKWSQNQRLEKEKEVLKFYVSGHPLNRYLPHIKSLSNMNLGDTKNFTDGEPVKVCGLVTNVRTRLDKKNRSIAFVMLEDLQGKAECIFWSEAYEQYGGYLKKDSVIWCIGKAKIDNDSFQITVDKILPITEAVSRNAIGYIIWIDISVSGVVEKLELLHGFMNSDEPGNTKILFNIYDSTGNYSKVNNDTASISNASNNNASIGKKYYNKSFMSYDINIMINEEATRNIVDLFGENRVQFILK